MRSAEDVLEWGRVCELLAGEAESELGQERARRLRPLAALDRLEGIVAGVHDAGRFLAEQPGARLRGARDLRALLDSAARGSGLDGPSLAVILETTSVGMWARRRFASPAAYPGLHAATRAIPDLEELRLLLERSVDRAGEVLDTAHAELAPLRRRLRDMALRVRQLADDLARRPELQAVVRPGPPVSRDGRLMFAVKAESRGSVPGVLHDRSGSGSSVFIEPYALVEPQNELMDLRSRERNLEGRALLEATRAVLRRSGELVELQNAVGHLDLLFARARFGGRYGGVLVPVRASGPLRLGRAYHPLLLHRELGSSPAADALEHARARVVPFDLELGADFDVLVVTGPNTGGKTVCLKTVGLVALMALAAVPAPVAEGSVVPLFESVFADIGDEQDLEQSLSTFSAHLRRISQILRQAGPRSLVLLDELGTGTDPQEGEALSHALLLHLLERGCMVVATTHLSGLKELGHEVERIENASLEFDRETLKPLYRLTLGLPGASCALAIARRHGIPPDIVARAEASLYQHLGEEGRRALEGIQRSREAVLQKLEGVERDERRVGEQRLEFEARIRELEERARVLEFQKEQEIERILAEIRGEGLRLLEDLGTLPAALAARVDQVRGFLQSLPRKSSLSRRRNAYIDQLKRDDRVYLPRYREHCRVRRVDRGRQQVEVLYRSLPLEVSYSEIACPEDFLEPSSAGDSPRPE